MPEYVTGENPSGKKVPIQGQPPSEDYWNAKPPTDGYEEHIFKLLERMAAGLEAIAQNTRDLVSAQGNVSPPKG